MGDAGVTFSSGKPFDAVATANCLAVVTPDGERTMSTFLGACRELSSTDISEDLVRESKLVFLEGYLFDSPNSGTALRRTITVAKKNGVPVALTLSDANCVRRNLDAFWYQIIRGNVDVLIANEKEIAALFEDEHPGLTTDAAIELCHDFKCTTVVTLGADGAVAVSNGAITRVPALAVNRIVDLVGAGDSFAAGYLVGHARDLPMGERLTLGAACAAEIITTNGARPARPLSELQNVSTIMTASSPAAA
jgi:sugar/nucleoside kinase (ribokinase family)